VTHNLARFFGAAICLFSSLGSVAHAGWETIGGQQVLIKYKDGDLGYFQMNIGREGDETEGPTVLESYRLCSTPEERSRNLEEVDKRRYPGGSSEGLCILEARCNTPSCIDHAGYVAAKKEIEAAAKENSERLPEKRLDEEGKAKVVRLAVERAKICPEGLEVHSANFRTNDYDRTFYLVGAVQCRRTAKCKDGFTRYHASPRDDQTSLSDCRRYGECPSKFPFRLTNQQCASCSSGGCPDLGRNPPMCVINMKTPENLSHCEEDDRGVATKYRNDHLNKSNAVPKTPKSDNQPPATPEAIDNISTGKG